MVWIMGGMVLNVWYDILWFMIDINFYLICMLHDDE